MKLKRLALVAVVWLALSACQLDRGGVLNQWPEHLRAKAHCIAQEESEWQPMVISNTGDWGLFQINRQTWERKWESVMRRPWRDSLNPTHNSWFAYNVVYLEGRGFREWSTNRRC